MGEAQEEVLCVPPGSRGPGPSQVAGRNSSSFKEGVRIDAYHDVRNWSAWMDLVLLARTLGIFPFGRGTY